MNYSDWAEMALYHICVDAVVAETRPDGLTVGLIMKNSRRYFITFDKKRCFWYFSKNKYKFVSKLFTNLNSSVFEGLSLAGSHGTYKELVNIPFKPQANESCGKCGICAASCPVGAIDKADPRKTDKGRCISCMRCRDICPKHARDLDPAFMQAAAEKMAPKLGGHKKNYLFL